MRKQRFNKSARMEVLPLSEAMDIRRKDRRRIERWRRLHPDSCGVAVYTRFPLYGIENSSGNLIMFPLTIRMNGRKIKRRWVQYRNPWQRVWIRKLEPGDYEIDTGLSELDCKIRMDAGDVFEVYLSAARGWMFKPRSHQLVNRIYSGFFESVEG